MSKDEEAAQQPAVDLSDLISTVNRQTSSREPLDRLAAAVRIAEELNGKADALLDYYVELARNANHSWTEIGAAIGVSKQAVQQRFVSLANMNQERLTDRARKVLVLAQLEATETHRAYVGLEHFLAALLREGEGVAGVVLTELGLTR